MKFVDTHTHLYVNQFQNDRDDVIERAFEAGVDKLIFPNVDLTTVEPLKELANKYPDSIFKAMGLHPTEVGENWHEVLQQILKEFAGEDKYIAVGEIGMDLYWDKTYADQQMQVFEEQIKLAQNLNLPLIIHCREALEPTLEVLKPYKDVSAVFHSFGGTEKDVEAIRRIGDYYFGINGVVTFKNSSLRDTLPAIGLDRILLETDSPYLAPVPNRGKRNESSYIPLIAEHIADSLSFDIHEIAQTTTSNAHLLFAI